MSCCWAPPCRNTVSTMQFEDDPSSLADAALDLRGNGPNVLVVDDNPRNLLAFVAVLESLGRPIVTALSGTAALQRLLDEDFALILMDVQMPGIDGYETARLIRSRPRN